MGSRRYLDKRLLTPGPEGLGASETVLGRGHEMPVRSEMTVDHGVRREEPLRLLGQVEAPHRALSPALGPV